MKKLIFCLVSCASILMFCLTAQSAEQTEWSQPVDTTNALAGKLSQAVVTPPSDNRSADDWKCSDGTPITQINWWGDYHRYLDDNPGAVDPPTVLPTSFILRQYSNDATDPSNTQPGTLIKKVEIPIAQCNQTFFQTVSTPTFGQIHIFSYAVTLDTPWTQTKDSIYWLSVQAQYDVDPLVPGPPPGSYLHWEWLYTPPGDFQGTGLVSSDEGATWSNPSAPDKINFAFHLMSASFSPFNLKLGSAVLPTRGGTIVLSADITVKGTAYAGVPCLPYVAITAGGTQFFILSGNKITTKMTPYLTAGKGKNRYFKLYDNIPNLPIASISYPSLDKGQYPVVGALLNNKGALMGQLAERTLTIQ